MQVEFKRAFGTDLIYFDEEEVRNLVNNFNQYNDKIIKVAPKVSELLWAATGGYAFTTKIMLIISHPGFIVRALESIEENCGNVQLFDESLWYKWKAESFENAISSSRMAKQVINLQDKHFNWRTLVLDLLNSPTNSLQISDTSMTNVNPMIKSGILCQVPGSANTFTFANSAVCLLLLRKILAPLSLSIIK